MSAKKASKAPAPKLTPMEQILGPNLLVDVNTSKPTKEVLKGKDLVLIYFSAAWCPPCKGFTPVLSEFYNKQAEDGKLEIVYVSSDKDVKEFEGYFTKMPWVAQPVDAASATKKQELAEALKIKSIPVLVVLDVKTGKFVTDMARTEVATAGNDDEKQKQVVAAWKAIEPVAFEDAIITGGMGPLTFGSIVYSFLKNPVAVFALMYGIKKLIRLWVGYQRKKAMESGEGDAGEGGEL